MNAQRVRWIVGTGGAAALALLGVQLAQFDAYARQLETVQRDTLRQAEANHPSMRAAFATYAACRARRGSERPSRPADACAEDVASRADTLDEPDTSAAIRALQRDIDRQVAALCVPRPWRWCL